MKNPIKKQMKSTAKSIAGGIDYPSDAFFEVPSIHVTERDDAVIENCRGILAVEENRIMFDMGEYSITMFGKGLVIKNLSKSGLCVEGLITTLTFDKKAEDGNV